MNNNDYIRLSLELHLFFARIMKEHSLFLEAAFTEKDNDLKKVARDFQKIFSDILNEVITLAEGNVSKSFISSNEMVTKNTFDAETKTSALSGIPIDMNITNRELKLRSGSVNVNEKIMNDIGNINKRALPFIENLIHFKNDILNKVLTCKMYTTNYPLLITHIMNEAKMYYTLLSKIEKREEFTAHYLYEQELFWNNIMKEHAEFIRGLLDPSEKELIKTADKYAREYEMIVKNYSDNFINLTNASLKETKGFREFKIAGEEGILGCKIKSIIIPLLADHVVREANHFIRILESFKS
ncbi:MAG: DUF2935 domain-containing protein [Bacilli bacterium]